jgi:hypothetical protein
MIDTTKFKPKTVYVTYIATTAEKVWHALTDPAFSKQYFFGFSVDVEPRVTLTAAPCARRGRELGGRDPVGRPDGLAEGDVESEEHAGNRQTALDKQRGPAAGDGGGGQAGGRRETLAEIETSSAARR